MTEALPHRRRRHVAVRARGVAAGLSATAFLGFGGAMAIAAHSSAAGATGDDQDRAPRVQTGGSSSVDPFSKGAGDDRYGYGDDVSPAPSSGNGFGWGAQPAPASPGTGSGSASGGASGGAIGNTSTHGS